jgi:hypothetical protein
LRESCQSLGQYRLEQVGSCVFVGRQIGHDKEIRK